jgi:large conductance mechanosensitive channel
MAVGIIIGGAFGTIVQSLVKDVIMPPIGLLLGGVDFSDIKIPLKAATEAREAVTMNIGTFLNNVISFLIVAAAVFALIKAINELRKRREAGGESAGRPAADGGLSQGDPRRSGEEVVQFKLSLTPRLPDGGALCCIALIVAASQGPPPKKCQRRLTPRAAGVCSNGQLRPVGETGAD